MSLRRVRWGAAAFFAVYAVAVTWPGAVPFNRIRPLVLGLPLSMVWVALWLVLAFAVLTVLDRFETRDEDERNAPGVGSESSGPGSGEAGRRPGEPG